VSSSLRPRSALPSPRARVLAFVSILFGGFLGGVIGAGFTGLQCSGVCETPKAIGGAIGAIITAAGTAVVAVLVLRAMGEWKATQQTSSPASSNRTTGERT
jgi:hypothetical protein